MWNWSLITGRSKRALSLAELMVVISLTLILGLILVRIYSVAGFTFLTSNNRINAQQNARFGLNRMSALLKCAMPPNATTTAISASGGNSINFYVPKLALGLSGTDYRNLTAADFPNICIWQSGDVVTVSGIPSGANIQNGQVLCRGVQSLSFAVSGLNNVTITLTLKDERSGRGATNPLVFSTVVQIPYYYLTK